MNEKRYLTFSREAYGLFTEILDGSLFSPILGGTKHFARVML